MRMDGPAVSSSANGLMMSRYKRIAPRPAPPSPSLPPASSLPHPELERAMIAAASRWARNRRRARENRHRRVLRRTKLAATRRSSSAPGLVPAAACLKHVITGHGTQLEHTDAARSIVSSAPAEVIGCLSMADGSLHNLLPQSTRAQAMGTPLSSPNLLKLKSSASSGNPETSGEDSYLGMASVASSVSSGQNYFNPSGDHHSRLPFVESGDEILRSNVSNGSSVVDKDLWPMLDQNDGEDSRNLLMSLEIGSDSSHVTQIVEDVECTEENGSVPKPPTLRLFPATTDRIASPHYSFDSANFQHGMTEKAKHQYTLDWIPPIKPAVFINDIHKGLHYAHEADVENRSWTGQDTLLPVHRPHLPLVASQSGKAKEWSPDHLAAGNVTASIRFGETCHGRKPVGNNIGTPATVVPNFRRLVRSFVSLINITEVRMEGVLSRHEFFEVLMKQHEGLTSPVIISNHNIGIHVKWVNTAYKLMIGQPRCPWLASLVAGSRKRDGCNENIQSALPAGEVHVHCCVKFPNSACDFSGCVKVEWTKFGSERRNSMALPCDVSRWVCEDDGSSVLFVWKLDVDACLRLACGE